MQVHNNISPVRLLQNQGLPVLKLGQYIKVEIIEKGPNGQGVISMAGKNIPAQLEAHVRAGEKFWASVREINQNSIVLKKENIPSGAIHNLSPQETMLLANRGLSLEPRFVQLLTGFISAENSSLLSLLAGTNLPFSEYIRKLLRTAVPSWQTIKENNSILNYLRILGIDNENLIMKMFKNGQNPEKNFTNIKLELLRVLAEYGNLLSRENKLFLNQFLNEITGQQLWYQTGVHENAYTILHFPLEDNEKYYLVKLAIESPRKGRKIDLQHCRIALQLETPNLGIIGADLLFYGKELSLSLLSNNPEVLEPMLKVLEDEVKECFSQLGINLESISLKKMKEHPQFEAFINGQQLGGVDVQG
ncbi:MAG: flagellar hook-length control protein FliK [Peptococcaceae bacterium]|nr:flagellar hook-length control protein FliK [Peptococcaceae bacterium]